MPPPIQSAAGPSSRCDAPSRAAASRDAAAGRADRMADGDRSAVDVDLGGIDAKLLVNGAGLRREGSFSSKRSTSATFQPTRCNAFFEAATGPMPMMEGSGRRWQPPPAQVASGRAKPPSPNSSARLPPRRH